MTTEPATAEADARRWAIQTLELEQHGEPFDAASMLRLVAQSDYVLSAEWADAVQIVANPGGLASRLNFLDRAAAFGRHQRRRVAVTSFRQQFFELSCAERRRRWETLVSECVIDPILVAQLQRLEPGLDVELPPFAQNSQYNHLIQTCREIFLAHPADAARLLRAFCEMWRCDVATWDNVTVEALGRHSHFVESVAPWIDEFVALRWRELESELKEHRRRSQKPFKPDNVGEHDTVPRSRWEKFWAQTEWLCLWIGNWCVIALLVGWALVIVRELWRGVVS